MSNQDLRTFVGKHGGTEARDTSPWCKQGRMDRLVDTGQNITW